MTSPKLPDIMRTDLELPFSFFRAVGFLDREMAGIPAYDNNDQELGMFVSYDADNLEWFSDSREWSPKGTAVTASTWDETTRDRLGRWLAKRAGLPLEDMATGPVFAWSPSGGPGSTYMLAAWVRDPYPNAPRRDRPAWGWRHWYAPSESWLPKGAGSPEHGRWLAHPQAAWKGLRDVCMWAAAQGDMPL